MLRKTQPVFGTSNYTYSLYESTKRLELIDPSMQVNILGNFGITSSSVKPEFSQPGKWYEYFTGDSINVSDVSAPLNFLPGEYRLYSTKKLESPKLILGVEEHKQAGKEGFVTVYPNPSPDEFTFEINSLNPSQADVSIFNLTGTMIRQIKTSFPASGIQTIKWDGKSANGTTAPTGIYIVNIRTTLGNQALKIIKK